MKRSLGRRSSSRNPPRAMLFTDFESAKKERKSGIPVRRATSTDRNISTLATPLMTTATPVARRATSEDRNSMLTYSARSQGFSGGTERPSRATTLSTNSTRLSSYGGARSKRDPRPIEDKDWQLAAQRKIENFLVFDPVGCELLTNGSIKPLNLKLFLSVVDLLLKRLDGNEEKTYIHKDNYITELPFIMKKLIYRGKIEKSWLISVNTARSWCHALACIDFLVSCVTSQQVIDTFSVMFPEKYDNDEEEVWNYRVLLPYLQRSFHVYKSNEPAYEEIQAQLDKELIEAHISGDNVYERISSLQSDIEKIKQESNRLSFQLEKVKSELQDKDSIFNDLKDEKSKYEEYMNNYNQFLNEANAKRDSLEKHIEKLLEDLERKKKKKIELEKAVTNQEVSREQLAELKHKRDSLKREIDREEFYLSTFEDMVHQSSIEVLAQKKKIDDLTKKYNLEIMKYISFGLENAMLDSRKGEEEVFRTLEIAQTAINSAKAELHALTESSVQSSVDKISEELALLEKNFNEKNNYFTKLVESHSIALREEREVILKLNCELKTCVEKLDMLNIDCDKMKTEKAEKEKLAEEMKEQLVILKANAEYIITEGIKLLEEYDEKNKELDEQINKLLVE